MTPTPRDLALAVKAKNKGANYSLRIIMQARESGVPISLAFALVEQESGFQNVFGHDPTISIPENWKGSKVTKSKYEFYKKRRHDYGMQGVGPCQLTWYGYQDLADQRGGCWIPKHNISVAMDHLASLLKKHGTRREALAAYNGTGPKADVYATKVLQRAAKWHNWLV